MIKKLMIASMAGIVILGGAAAVGAISNSNQPKSISNKNEETTNVITMDEAVKIAIDEVGGVLENVELERENGRLIYEIEIGQNNKDDIDVDVDAISGEIMKVDPDDDSDHKSYKQEAVSPKISMKEAIAIAIKDTQGEIKGIDFDSDDQEYEIEIIKGNSEVEIKIDAKSGSILKKDIDQD